jgi:ATP-dependent Clp protease adaptor protein ClpS
MSDSQVLEPKTSTQPRDAGPRRLPPFHVVLLDDDDHSYEYVVEMLCRLFGHTIETAYQMAVEVDTFGRVIVDTTTLERAEFKRDQIQNFGADIRITRCQGAMSAVIQPAGRC